MSAKTPTRNYSSNGTTYQDNDIDVEVSDDQRAVVEEDEGVAESRLRDAAQDGDLTTVQQLLATDIDPDFPDPLDLRTALHLAAEAGHLEVVKELLKAGADISKVNTFGNTALHWAVGEGHEEIAKALLEAGTPPDVCNLHTEMTPLHWAASDGHLDLVSLLLSFKASMRALTAAGYTPLHEASHNGHAPVVKVLLYHGADPEIPGKDQKTARDLAVEVGAWECVAMLDGVGKQLRQAAIEGKLNRTLGLLSNEGCDVNDVDQDSGDIALHHAAQGGWSAVVRALCHHGANPNAQNLDGATPCHLATSQGHVETMEVLISNGGVNLEVPNRDGDTMLTLAAAVKSTELVAMFLANKAVVNAANTAGQTALLLAARHGNVEMVTMLLRARANVEAKDTHDRTPLLVAAMHGHHDVINSLLETGAHVEARDKDKNTPLHLAAKHGHALAVAALLGGGSSITSKGENHRNAKMHAEHEKHTSVETMLKAWQAQIEASR